MTTLQSERVVIKLTSHSPAQHHAGVSSERRRNSSQEAVLGAWGLDCGAWSQSKEQNRMHKINNQCTWRCIKHARVDCKSFGIIGPFYPYLDLFLPGKTGWNLAWRAPSKVFHFLGEWLRKSPLSSKYGETQNFSYEYDFVTKRSKKKSLLSLTVWAT